FDPEQGKYIKTFPLHESQHILTDNNKEFRIRLHLHITYDLIMELLSYGEKVEVIKPKSLRKDLVKIYQNAIKNNSAP
ncbi:MAG: WYL domain-containing protein, partial [Bacteroidales bacterium]|nr:WYL domain-containing protein [Bacteroidales bacterium]